MTILCLDVFQYMVMWIRNQPTTQWSRLITQFCCFGNKHAPGTLEHVFCGFDQYLENFVVIWAGGTRAQGLGAPDS